MNRGLEKQMETAARFNRRYIFVGEFGSQEKAQLLGQELEAMRDAGIEVTTEAVMERLTDPAHPLHDMLTWDNLQAAMKYRLDEVRGMIAKLHVVIETKDGGQITRKAEFSVTATENKNRNDRQYVSFTQVEAAPDRLKEIEQQALREIRYWAKKYSDLGLERFQPVYELVERELK